MTANTPVTKARHMRQLLAKGIVVSPGIFDGYSARIVEKMGFEAANTSGAGLSNSRLGKPDVGILTMTENVEACRHLVNSTSLPRKRTCSSATAAVMWISSDARDTDRHGMNISRGIQEWE